MKICRKLLLFLVQIGVGGLSPGPGGGGGSPCKIDRGNRQNP